MSKKTVGQQVQENKDKHNLLEGDVRDYTEAMEPMIIERLYSTALQASKHDLYTNRDFYIVLVKNADRVLKEPKFQIWARRSCPTPVYKQDVFKYHHISGELEFLWSLPSIQRYYHILQHKRRYLDDSAWRGVAQFVISMENGDLLRWAKKENGEKPDAIIRINKEIDQMTRWLN